jgi:hypothetical protein
VRIESKLNIFATVGSFSLTRRNNMENNLKVGGVFTIEHYNKDGDLLAVWEEKNLVTNEGLNDLLNEALSAAGNARSWYVGLFESNYTPTSADTAAVPGFTESTAYDEATRPAWTDAGASSQQITNSASKAVFTMNATKTIYGAFLSSLSTKGGVTGVLFASSRFSASRAVVATDVLNITYTIQAASA